MNVARAASLVLYHTVYGPVAAIVREDSTPQGIASLFVLDRETPQNVDIVPFGTGEGCWSWPIGRAEEAKAAPAPSVPGKLVPTGVPGIALSAGPPATVQQRVPAPSSEAAQVEVPGPNPTRNMSPDPNRYAAPASQIAVTADEAARELAADPTTDGSAEVTDKGVENIL